jgi:glycine/D-amino acid oxidase-like deaminating enzyme
MHYTHYDIIIVGQGISGTVLSSALMEQHQKVLVIDDGNKKAASKIASGVINPVTGRRIVKTWQIDAVMPAAVRIFKALENKLNTQIIQQCNIVNFHASEQMEKAFASRLAEDPTFLSSPRLSDAITAAFDSPFGHSVIDPCWLVHLENVLAAWRQYLIEKNALIEDVFDFKKIEVTTDQVVYKNYTANQIIFCEGAKGQENPYFKQLPFAPNKGEALLVKINDLDNRYIYKKAVSIVPWKDAVFWVGSNYEWDNYNDDPSPSFKEKTMAALNEWLTIPYEVIDHIAAIRPANTQRRPFVGMHPIYKNIGIFNGMGTKGCSLAPFFAEQLTSHILQQTALDNEASIDRFNILATK